MSSETWRTTELVSGTLILIFILYSQHKKTEFEYFLCCELRTFCPNWETTFTPTQRQEVTGFAMDYSSNRQKMNMSIEFLLRPEGTYLFSSPVQ